MNRVLKQAVMAVTIGTLLTFAAPGFGQSPSEQYQELWREVATSLVAFSNANLATADPAALAVAYGRAEERFSAAFTRLSQMAPPAELMLSHWQLVPLLEQVQAEMKSIRRGAEAHDPVTQEAGWNAFRDTLNLLRLTVGEDKHENK